MTKDELVRLVRNSDATQKQENNGFDTYLISVKGTVMGVSINSESSELSVAYEHLVTYNTKNADTIGRARRALDKKVAELKKIRDEECLERFNLAIAEILVSLDSSTEDLLESE